MFSQIGPLEIILILVVVLLIFGPKRLPGLGRQLGGGLREFKDSLTGEGKADQQSADQQSADQESADHESADDQRALAGAQQHEPAPSQAEQASTDAARESRG
jgi:sec-independent protein translocase protein TatA